MKVIGSGFGRTGTLSMQAALQQLGFGPCYHMVEAARRPSHVRAWVRVARGGTVDWQTMFAQFESSVDFPASLFYLEMLAAFPNAKVVHTVRDPESWYHSTHETIYQSQFLFPHWLRRLSRHVDGVVEMTQGLLWNGLFEGRFEDKEHALKIFVAHTQRVCAQVPADRLLIFDVRQGWQPLCAFLNVPIPNTPFPNLNDRQQMRRALTALRWLMRLLPWTGLALLCGLIVLVR